MVQELGKAYFRPDTTVGLCGSPDNIVVVSHSYHGDALSLLCDCKRLVQYSGSKTMVFYSQNPHVPIFW